MYKGSDWKERVPLDESPMTRRALEDLHEMALERGVKIYRASIDWFDILKLHFKKAWTFLNKKWIKINNPVKPDLIFDKIVGKYDYELFKLKQKINQKIKIFNPPIFRTILDNKLSQYIIFKEFMPQSFIANTREEFKSTIKKVKSEMIVIKPLYGSGGSGVIISKKDKVSYKKCTFPSLVQEFITSEIGIPGLTKSKIVADLRLVLMNHKIIYALSRIAKKNSLFTNFHKGARPIFVPKKHIPPSVINISRKIIDRLKIFPEANYSIDFLIANSGKPMLIEINTTPGFDLLYIIGKENKNIWERNLDELTKVLNG